MPEMEKNKYKFILVRNEDGLGRIIINIDDIIMIEHVGNYKSKIWIKNMPTAIISYSTVAEIWKVLAEDEDDEIIDNLMAFAYEQQKQQELNKKMRKGEE